ncbi:MAG: hypothetical protein HFG29_02735 [Eubacterium sp.]|nr:hypothetical protein [Eubacterium sp.]
MKRFIIVGEKSSYSEMYKIMCGDVIGVENIYFINDPYSSYTFINRGFRKLLRKLRLKNYCEQLYTLYKQAKLLHKHNKKDEINVIFFNAGLRDEYSEQFLEKLKKKFHVKIGIVFVDSFGTFSAMRAQNLLLNTDLVDYAYTIEDEDLDKSNKLTKCFTPYAKINGYADIPQKHDIYFGGTIKTRGGIIKNCIEKLINNNIKVKIELFTSMEEMNQYKFFGNYPGVSLEDYSAIKDYSQMIVESLESDVLLDITDGGQTALTLRPYEAVVYNKRLLTNNKSILDFKFYDPRYMRYFTEITDEDVQWIKKKEKVDYNYNHQFSIANIINHLTEEGK